MGDLGWGEGPYAPHDAMHTHMFATGLLLVVVGGKGYGKANPHFPPSRSSRFCLHPPPCVYTILDGRNHTQKGTGSKNATTHVCVCVRDNITKRLSFFFVWHKVCPTCSFYNFLFVGGKAAAQPTLPRERRFCFWFISLYSSLSLSLTFFLPNICTFTKEREIGKTLFIFGN